MKTKQLIHKFYEANPDIDLLRANLHLEDTLASIKIPKTKSRAAATDMVEQLKQIARVVRLHPEAQMGNKLTADAIVTLYEKFDGLNSAHDIARQSGEVFVKQYTDAFGCPEVASEIYQRATEVTNNVANLTNAILNMSTPLSKAISTSSVSEEVTGYFTGLVGYQELFGSLNYCDCPECKSVLGPAAYFADLMRIVQKYITEPNTATIPHASTLAVRRPDLGTIPLTCEKTNTIVPYLQIIIERLEQSLSTSWKIAGTTDLYKQLAATYYPFNLPFLQPLSSIRIYLEELKTTLAEVFACQQLTGPQLAAEQLQTTLEGWNLLKTATVDTAKLQTYFGVAKLDDLNSFKVFSKQTDLLVTQVQDLLYQNLSDSEITAGLNAQFFINKGLTKPIVVGNTDSVNTIDNLTPTALDQINRYLRLTLLSEWSFDDLDWALHVLNNGTPEINESILQLVPKLQQLVTRMNSDVATVSTYLFDLKTYGMGNDPAQSTAPFDIVFNTGQTTLYHPKNSATVAYPLNKTYLDTPLSWEYASDSGNNPDNAVRVASALGISQNDLQLLVFALYESTPTIVLNVPTISALSRHVRLAGYFKLSIQDYLSFLSLSGKVQLVFTIDDLTALIDNKETLATVARLTLEDLNYTVNAVVSPTVNILYYPDKSEAWLKTLPILIPASDSENDQLIKLYEQVGAFFGIPSSLAQSVLALTVTNPLSIFLNPDTTNAIKALSLISRWLVWVEKTGVSQDLLDNIAVSKAAYGITDTTKLTFANSIVLLQFQFFTGIYNDVNNRFSDYMTAITSNKNDVAAAILSEATGWDKSIITALYALKYTNQVDRLYSMQAVITLLNKTGLNLDAFQGLLSLAGKGVADWDKFGAQENKLLTAIQARYNIGSDWNQLAVQIGGKTASAQRDALIGATIFALRSDDDTAYIQNTRDLHDYLLIDVDMSDVAQISYIKEALNAIQLYMNRCRSKLESGVVLLPIPEVWWEWMMNYRVWEANREIFLYPENYLDPAFRSSKTDLFKQLENDLKQNDITEGNVTSAYTKYLEGFAELAKLVYVDAYYCRVSDDTRDNQPTLFLFARTATNPYTYYYITRESEGTWSQWIKIDLAINAVQITPVYAFNKLFLFWVEQSVAIDKTPNTTTENIVKASINYTFYNFQNQWVPAQSLVKDYIIDVSPSAYRTANNKLFPDNFFDPNSLWWNKVYPLKIQQDSFWEITNGGNRFEQLVIAFGPMIDTTVQYPQPANNPPNDSNPAVQVFENQLFETGQNYNYVYNLGYKGQLPLFKPIVLNDSLDSSYLVNPDEILFFEKDSDKSNHLFTPQIDATSGQMNLISTSRTIYDNDIAGQIITPAIPTPQTSLTDSSFISTDAGINAAGSKTVYNTLVDYGYIDSSGMLGRSDYAEMRTDVMSIFEGDPGQLKKTQFVMGVVNRASGSRWLSQNVRNKNYGLFTIKNAVGTFVFYGDKEAFLMEDPDKDPVFISDLLFNGDTMFLETSFLSSGAGIDATGSSQIYNNLIDYGYFTADGQLERGTTINDLTKALNEMLEGQPNKTDKVDSVLDILTNQPLFYNTDFISDSAGINSSGSKNIFDQLMQAGYLDKNGRLMTDIDFNELTGVLYDILKGQPDIDKKVRFVVQVLYQAEYPSSIGFFRSLNTTPYACEYNFKAIRLTTGAIHNLSARIFSGGVDKLLSLESQLIPVDPELPFNRFGFEEPYVIAPEAPDGGQVDFNGAYELYYWELFFHAPMYIANLLKTNQVFDQAEKWYKYIYDPTAAPYLVEADSFVCATIGVTDSSRIYRVLLDNKWIDSEGYVSSKFTAKTNLNSILSFLQPVQIQSVKNVLLNHQVARDICRVWQFNPFRNHTVASLLENITNAKQIAAYNQYPFDPHAIARLRIGAYEKTMVMQYIDNLIKWGDWYFSQYTWESNTMANMLYIYAYNLLGPKPEDLGPCKAEDPANFNDIVAQYGDNIPQFKITLEDHVGSGSSGLNFQPYNDIDAYFCVPENDKLEQYWDTVIDRLYKINNSLNINGIPQPLQLFEPPIDPGLLARAAASGGNPLSIMTNNAAIPAYRFEYLIDRVKNFASTLSQLGSGLLSALERKDDSALAKLQATQQNVLLNLNTMIKEQEIEEAKQNIAGLQQNLLSAQNREQFYQQQYDENLSPLEIASLSLQGAAIYPESVSIGINGISIAGYLAPNIFGFADGGMKFGDAINAGAQIAQTTSSILNQSAGIIATTAQYNRRRDDWKLQQQTATYDVAQIQDQINSANAQLLINQQNLVIHKKTIDQENAYEQFLTTRFTNMDLYSWMISRLSTIYFQSYQLTLGMALAAQSAYQNEMNSTEQFIQFDYWDTLHKGLLSGEALLLSLQQMERSYVLKNTRTFEIEKTISLLQLDPLQFMEFKTGLHSGVKGTLRFKLSEQLFDFDFPGQYLRKIKTISVSIPAVVGPYQNINAVLRQTKNYTVMEPKINAVKYVMDPVNNPDPGNVRVDWIPNQKIALSKGMDDNGLFVLNFNDSMYLPFEGTGAVSEWELNLPPETNHFDFNSISDIIIKISYTAYEDMGQFANDVKNQLQSQNPPYPYQVAKQIVLQQAFSANWYQFMHPQPNPVTQSMVFSLTDAIVLPNLNKVALQSITVVVQTQNNTTVSDKQAGSFLTLKQSDKSDLSIPITNNVGTVALSGPFEAETAELLFTIANTPDELLTDNKKQLDPNKLTGLLIIINYTSNVFAKQ